MKVGVARETASGERRVALVPDALGKLTAAGLEVLVESGAGLGAQIPDASFTDAGAQVVSTADLYATADVILRVQKPAGDEIARLRPGQVVIGLLEPLIDPATAKALADRGDCHQPRRAASDAQPRPGHGRTLLTGQRRRLQGSPDRRRSLRSLLSAADDARPAPPSPPTCSSWASASPACRRSPLLAVWEPSVKAYDVRRDTKEQAESLGAQFLTLKSARRRHR